MVDFKSRSVFFPNYHLRERLRGREKGRGRLLGLSVRYGGSHEMPPRWSVLISFRLLSEKHGQGVRGTLKLNAGSDCSRIEPAVCAGGLAEDSKEKTPRLAPPVLISWEGERCPLPSSSFCWVCRVHRRPRRGTEKTWHVGQCLGLAKAGLLSGRLRLNSCLSSSCATLPRVEAETGGLGGCGEQSSQVCFSRETGVWQKQPWQLCSVAWWIKGFYMFHSKTLFSLGTGDL